MSELPHHVTPSSPPAKPSSRLLVVDRDEVRLFSELRPGTEALVLPAGDGPDFFATLGRALHDEGPVLIFGTDAKAGAIVERFRTWLGIHRTELAGRIAGSMILNDRFRTNGQLLTQARNHLFNRPSSTPPADPGLQRRFG